MAAFNIKKTLLLHRHFFNSGITRDAQFRLNTLKRLYRSIERHQEEIIEALHKDFNKPRFEAYTTEIGVVLEEIHHIRKHLKKWMKPQKVKSTLPLIPGTSRIYAEPYGTVLIIAPWNYPFQLIMSPLVGALAAGNTAVIKPASDTKATADIIETIIDETFTADYVTVFRGTRKQANKLLEAKFDYLFFTGGTYAGRMIAQAAAKNLTPCTLELGGKSPVIVTSSADIELTAKRIIWGKFINAGQTCIAPDYVLVQEKIKDDLISMMKKVLKAFYGDDVQSSPDYSRIINPKQFARISRFIKGADVAVGGTVNRKERYIEPTILDNVSLNDEIMNEEIFGPILPVLTYKRLDDAIAIVKSKPKPLALYLFTKNKEQEQKVNQEVSFGGGCVNDVIFHVANPNLPFGGVGYSGMGSYHGEHSFKTFSHMKSIVKKPFYLDMFLRYPPYTEGALNLVKKLLK